MTIFKNLINTFLYLAGIALVYPLGAFGQRVEYDLTISEKQVNIAEKSVPGITINGGIPGPTLFFEEGDIAIIRVKNMMDVPSSIHWHGILLPNNMDGVPFLTYPPIAPHSEFTYEFPIRHSGTYWYHSHTSLQEQKGAYGSIVIYPKGILGQDEVRTFKADEKVVLLSDWTNENPHAVMRSLRQGNEWYSVKKGSSQSIFGAMKAGMLSNYLKRELQRMPPMDIADVGYDAFLINGVVEDSWIAQPGENVRLRVINAGASSFFYLSFAGGPMTVVSADGIDIEPIELEQLLITTAETYDIIVKVPHHGSSEFRATAHDNSGYGSLWIGSGKKQFAQDLPYPNLYEGMGSISLKKIFAWTPAGSMGMPTSQVSAGDFDQPGMSGMHDMFGMDMNHNTNKPMIHESGHHDMASMQMEHSDDMALQRRDGLKPITKAPSPLKFLASDISSHARLVPDGSPERPWSPYSELRSLKPTNFGSDRTLREFRLTLDGDMERYVWLINNKRMTPSDSIVIKHGEVARFIMINRTMMHHPMHLHGHFFRVINAQGDHSPLKHTVDVPPMSTVVIEFDANDSGDWFIHCHNLYHMHTGMMRVVHYEGFEPHPRVQAIRHNLYKDNFFLLGHAYLLSNWTSGVVELSNTNNILMGEWEYGFQDNADDEWELILTGSRYINRFFSVFVGADLLGEKFDELTVRGIAGFKYLLPLNVDLRIWLDTDLGSRVNLGKHFALTPRVTLNTEIEYDRHSKWEGLVGLDFQITKHWFVSGQWHSEYKWGVGGKVLF